GGLAPHGGVGGGQEGGGDLNIVDAPLVGGGGKSRHVPGDAAPQGGDAVAPGQLLPGHVLQELAVGGQVFALFPGGERIEGSLEPRRLQGGQDPRPVQGGHRVVGHHQTPPGGGGGGGQLPAPVQQPPADVDGVDPGRGNRYCFHSRSLLSHPGRWSL